MPTVNMTDSDWLFAFSQMTVQAFAALAPLAGYGEFILAIPVTFDASETFVNFDIEVPLVAPGQQPVIFGQPQPNWEVNSNLILTKYELLGTPGAMSHGPSISGQNLSGSPLTINFYIRYEFLPALP